MKKVFEFLKELKKKPYGKAVFFFSFYLIFFIVIFLIITFGGKDKIDETESITGINVNYIQKYNYKFEYNVVVDNNTYNYVGSKDNSTFTYTYDSKEYVTSNGKTYTRSDSIEVENPIKFNKFFEEKNIDTILKSAYIESKTSYDNGNTVYNLLVSSNTLNKLIDMKDTDIDEVPNRVIVTLDGNAIVREINYDLSSYCKNNDSCNSLNIVINYKEFRGRS